MIWKVIVISTLYDIMTGTLIVDDIMKLSKL